MNTANYFSKYLLRNANGIPADTEKQKRMSTLADEQIDPLYNDNCTEEASMARVF